MFIKQAVFELKNENFRLIVVNTSYFYKFILPGTDQQQYCFFCYYAFNKKNERIKRKESKSMDLVYRIWIVLDIDRFRIAIHSSFLFLQFTSSFSFSF